MNIHVDANKEYLKLWFDSTGNVHMFAVNGNLQVTATNLSTGASVSINASGPARGVLDAQGNPLVNVSTGHYLNFFPLSLTTGILDFNTGILLEDAQPTSALNCPSSNSARQSRSADGHGPWIRVSHLAGPHGR